MALAASKIAAWTSAVMRLASAARCPPAAAVATAISFHSVTASAAATPGTASDTVNRSTSSRLVMGSPPASAESRRDGRTPEQETHHAGRADLAGTWGTRRAVHVAEMAEKNHWRTTTAALHNLG